MMRVPLVLFAAALAAGRGGAQEIEAGKKQFAALCAGCHGADGGGGEHGPNIVDTRRAGGKFERSVPEVIKAGIEDAGMPAFPLPKERIDELSAFVHSLRAPAADHPPSGDVGAGERYFFGKGDCAGCHTIRGRGGNLGPIFRTLGASAG